MESKEKEGKQICSECDKHLATVFCSSCPPTPFLPMCESCFKATHSHKAFSAHKSAPLTGRKDDGTMCKIHHELLYLFCVGCQVPVCFSCKEKGPHTGHEMSALQTAAQSVREELKRNMTVAQKAVEELEKLSKQVESKIQLTETSADKAVADVKQCQAQLRTLIQERLKTLTDAIEKKKAEPMEKLMTQRTKVADALVEAKATMQEAKAGLTKSDLGVLKAFRAIDQHTKNLQQAMADYRKPSETLTHVSVSFNNDKIQSVISSLGRIRPMVAVPEITVLDPQGNTLNINWEEGKEGGELPIIGHEVQIVYKGHAESKDAKEAKEVKESKNAKYKGAFTTVYEGTDCKYTVEGLEYESHYIVRIRSKDESGWSDWCEERKCTTSTSYRLPNRCERTMTGHGDYVRGITLLPGGLVVSGSDDSSVKIWNALTGALVRTCSGHSGYVHAVATLPDNNRIVSAGDDRNIRVWNSSNASQLASMSGHTATVRALAVLQNGNIASGGEDQTVRLWNATSYSSITSLTGHTGTVWALVVLPNGQLVSSAEDRCIRFWDTSRSSSQCVRTLSSVHNSGIYTLGVLADGRLVSGSDDRSIKIWGTADQPMTTLNGHTGSILSLLQLPNGMLASGAGDNSIKIWNIATGVCVKTLTGHSGSVRALKNLAPQNYLISGSNDRAVKVWVP